MVRGRRDGPSEPKKKDRKSEGRHKEESECYVKMKGSEHDHSLIMQTGTEAKHLTLEDGLKVHFRKKHFDL